MAARHGTGQYEDAFRPQRLQNWSVPRPGRQRPLLWEGSTTIIADDRGHLLPTVPRSQASPWGTFLGTWEMPSRIPPAWLDLSSRSAAAAARLLDQIHQPTALTCACNGLRTEITGKHQESSTIPLLQPQEPRTDTQTTKEPSQGSSGAPGEDTGSPPTPAPPRPSPREATEPRGSSPSRGGSGGQADHPFGKHLLTPKGEKGKASKKPERG